MFKDELKRWKKLRKYEEKLGNVSGEIKEKINTHKRERERERERESLGLRDEERDSKKKREYKFSTLLPDSVR